MLIQCNQPNKYNSRKNMLIERIFIFDSNQAELFLMFKQNQNSLIMVILHSYFYNYLSFLFFCLYLKALNVSFMKQMYSFNFLWVIIEMQSGKGKGMMLSVKSITWYKDSHSLFDYESNKINTNTFTFPVATKHVALYRKRQSNSNQHAACNVVAVDQNQATAIDKDEYQFLTKFEIKPSQANRFRLNFINDTDKKLKKINSERLNTDESNSVSLREEETYLIVRKQKDANGEPKGYKLQPGQTIKLGRVEFFVSEVCVGQTPVTAKGKEKTNTNKLTIKYNPADYKIEGQEKKACKICLQDSEEKDNFLFNPCKCSGSCGTVHLQCLLQWINIKVKKEVVGGTLHYNFQKFECEVCKAELPVVVQTQDQRVIQMLPIQKPKGNYMILEGACEKTKSVMMIQNVPQTGIKLGRGHDCEIRITDISVSRNHALIKFNGTGFYVFDNKSKFGTLVKEDNMNVQVGSKHQQGIQIGRTVVILDICKESDLKEKEKEPMQHKTQQHLHSKKAIDRDIRERR